MAIRNIDHDFIHECGDAQEIYRRVAVEEANASFWLSSPHRAQLNMKLGDAAVEYHPTITRSTALCQINMNMNCYRFLQLPFVARGSSSKRRRR